MIARSWVSGTSADGCCRRTKWIAHPVRSGVVPARWQPRRSVLDFTITATYFVTAIGAPFQKYDDILGHREHKDTEKNTLQVARSTRRRRAAGEACKRQTNDHWTVARSFVCGLRASRLGLRCRPPASSASVSQCLRGLSKSIRRRNCQMLYLAARGLSYSLRRRDQRTGNPAGAVPDRAGRARDADARPRYGIDVVAHSERMPDVFSLELRRELWRVD